MSVTGASSREMSVLSLSDRFIVCLKMSTFPGLAGHWDVWGKGQYVKVLAEIYTWVFFQLLQVLQKLSANFSYGMKMLQNTYLQIAHSFSLRYLIFMKCFLYLNFMDCLKFVHADCVSFLYSQLFLSQVKEVSSLNSCLLVGFFVSALYLMSTWLLGGLMSALRFSVYRKHRVFSNSCIYLSNSLYLFKEHLLVLFCFFLF